MPILEHIDPATKRSAPLVWISRIALFESLDPLTVIREPIEFTTGVNIVWGIENETNDEHLEPGHGVGKTTLCRLIRYCLGEPNYGQEHAAQEIRHTFPGGHVAAEVHIRGETWSVLRPFDKHRPDCAQANVSLEELIQNRPPRTSFNEYLGRLSSICLSGLRAESVLVGGASILWGQLLAMCARDQEARYQSLWQWRSPRSDSGPPKIQKEDAFLTLRSVLGLLPHEETTLQHQLADIGGELSNVEHDMTERRREPEYWVRHYRRSLHDDFRIGEAFDASLESEDMFGLPRLIERRIAQLEADQMKRLEELTTLDRKIAMAAVALQEPAELQEQETGAADVTESGTDTLLKDLEELRQLRQHISEAELSLCRYGQLTIGDCSHAQQQLVELDQQIRDAADSTLPKSAKRDQLTATLRGRTERRLELLTRLGEEVNKLNAERRELDDQRRRADTKTAALKKTLDDLVQWEKLRSGEQADSQLARLIARKDKLEADLTSAKDRLAALLADQDQRLIGLRQVYESLVRHTLSADFYGRVRLNQEGLEFRVFRGENLSGEAFETLSILLADLAVLLMGALGTAAHPGLLLHDSPREADLGAHIYRRLLVCMADVASELGNESSAPFQYIVTTTTPPPSGLRNNSTTRLKLGGEQGLLFGRQLHAASTEVQRDLPLEKSLQEEGETE